MVLMFLGCLRCPSLQDGDTKREQVKADGTVCKDGWQKLLEGQLSVGIFLKD